MTEQPAPQKKLTVIRALIVLIGLILLLELSFWADEKSFQVEGPSRIVKGPQDTLYIQIDRKIAKISKDGDVLHVVDLDADAAIPEHIADFFVEDDGRLLIARRDSQVLQYYSPEGKLIKTHERIPSSLVDGNHFCKFTKDAGTGTLYFADTSHHHIQIYGPDEKERKIIIVPSGAPVVVEHSADLDATRIASPDTPLYYPNGMTFDNDRLLATDTGNSRIIVFYPDGTADKIIPIARNEMSSLNNPIKVSRSGGTIYTILRGPNFLGGRVAAYDESTGRERYFLRGRTSIDPWDVFGRFDDVLVTDRESLSVLRYTPEGKFLDIFGKPSLQSLYADRQVARKTYQWLRKGSLACMLLVLVWLFFSSRKQRVSYEKTGQSLHKPLPRLQSFLGPMGSVRRKALLVLVPGLGQAAAGRILRALTFFVILAYFISLVVYSVLSFREGETTSLPVFITVMLMTYAAWMVVVLDGVRLSGKPADSTRRLSFRHIFIAIAFPLLTVSAAIAAQLLREAVAQSKPEISLAIQSLLGVFMNEFGGASSPFSVVFPAAVLLGWGGAAAGMFATLSFQAQAGRRKILFGIIFGFLAGIISWIVTATLVGDRVGSLFYMPAMQGITLSTLAFLFFRNNGMPLLIIPVAAAGAWLGSFVKLLVGGLDTFIMNILQSFGMGSIWMGTVTRIEFVTIIAFFIHLAVWVAWNAATTKPIGDEAS